MTFGVAMQFFLSMACRLLLIVGNKCIIDGLYCDNNLYILSNNILSCMSNFHVICMNNTSSIFKMVGQTFLCTHQI